MLTDHPSHDDLHHHRDKDCDNHNHHRDKEFDNHNHDRDKDCNNDSDNLHDHNHTSIASDCSLISDHSANGNHDYDW